jgi:cysteine-rich repeat protein
MTGNAPQGGAQLMGTTRLPDGRIAASNDPGGTLTLAYGGTCGDGVTDAGEDCDDGNVTPGDGCDPSCCVSDLDADGRCDSVDPCTAPVVMQKARLKVKGDINVRQAQPIIIKGQAVLPFPFSPALDPPATGVRLLVRNATRRVVDAVIPPGPGWIVSGRRWRWDGSVFPGIERIIVTNVPSAPGTIRVLIRGHGPYFFMGLKDLPLSFEVGMNAALAASGQCGQATFLGPAPLPSCVHKGDIQLSCR